MASKKPASIENLVAAARPLFDTVPYRMVVFKELNQHKVPVYLVAGVSRSPMRANKALRLAHEHFGGNCHYCNKPVTPEQLSIDHAEPVSKGGSDAIQNLLIACRSCNLDKGHRALDVYNPDAARDWLSALLRQVQERLNRLDENPKACAPPRPKPGAAAGP
jgi:5-methylcytosine-specific restriction endonuclease McrA